MSAAAASIDSGPTLIGRHPVLANAPAIAVLSGIAAAVFGTLTGALLGGILDIDFGPAITIPVWFLAIAGACLIYLGVAYRRVAVDAARGTATIDGKTVALRSITSGTLLSRTPAATVPALSLRLTTDTGTSARIIINGGWLRPIRTTDFIPLTALVAGSSIPDESPEDPIAAGRERVSRALAGKSTDAAITRRGFLIDCLSAAERSGDPELLAAVVAAAGPIGRSITEEAARIRHEQEAAAGVGTSGAGHADADAAPPHPHHALPAGTDAGEAPGEAPAPILPPAPQFGTVQGTAGQQAPATIAQDDDRFRRPDDPARSAAAGVVDRGHLDKLGERGTPGERGTDTADEESDPRERQLPSWVQPQDRARMLAWLDDDEDVVHLQPIPETAVARQLRRVCDWLLIAIVGLGFLAIFAAAIGEQVIDDLLPSDANELVSVAVVGAAFFAFLTWLASGVARAAEIRIAQRVSLDWLDARGPEQRRRGLPPVLLQHFLGPIPAGRLLTVGAYSCSVLGGIGALGGILLTVDPDELGAVGPVVLGIGLAITAAGVALFLLRWRSTKRQRELAVELGGERLAFLGNL